MFGPYTFFIFTSYLMSFLFIAGTIVVLSMAYRKKKQELEKLNTEKVPSK